MEFNAYWVLDSDYSQELGGCCLNATLRDYARLGIFAIKKWQIKYEIHYLMIGRFNY